jgi:hypothetical protein
MSINSKIMTALSGIVGGKIYSIQKPITEDPDVFIVFNPENEYLDYGDDRDQESEMSYQVHWYAKGVANYLTARRQIRDALRDAGFLLEPSPYVTYDTESGNASAGVQTGYTHMTIVCRLEDE